MSAGEEKVVPEVLEEPIQGASGISRTEAPLAEMLSVLQKPVVLDSEDEEIDREMEKVAEEMKALDRETVRRAKKEKLETMKRELELKKQKVKGLKGTPVVDISCRPKVQSTKTGDTIKGKSKQEQSSSKDKKKDKAVVIDIETLQDEQFDIESLRKDEKLKLRVRKELKKLGLDSSCSLNNDDDDSESSSSESDESSDSQEERKKKKKKNKRKKSGISAKASDKVKFPQEWPHAHLQYEYVNKQVKFEELNLKLFMAGELEIISGVDLSLEERQGRLKLLKKIVYYSSTYEFDGLKSFYAAWLRDIELGIKKWSDDPHEIEGAILSKYLFKNKGYIAQNKKGTGFTGTQKANMEEDRVWFCSLYQRNKCSHKSNHLIVIKGKQRLAAHICATCWQKDKKKLEHPESSSCCPHISA